MQLTFRVQKHCLRVYFSVKYAIAVVSVIDLFGRRGCVPSHEKLPKVRGRHAGASRGSRGDGQLQQTRLRRRQISWLQWMGHHQQGNAIVICFD